VVFQAAVDGALSVHGCASVHAVVELREDARDLHHLTGHYHKLMRKDFFEEFCREFAREMNRCAATIKSAA
jgi:hypothetical protein